MPIVAELSFGWYECGQEPILDYERDKEVSHGPVMDVSDIFSMLSPYL